jgi:TonB family protein
MHGLIHDNADFLTAWVLTSVGIAALALLAEAWLRPRASAASRHLLLFAALLAPPALLVLAFVDVGLAPATATARVEMAKGAVTPAPQSDERDVACVVAALWAAGALIALGRTARDAARWRAAAARAVPVHGRRMPIDHPVEVSDACREPAVAGILDPTILLPAGSYLEALSDEELETVLVHELEHVRRRDNLRALVVQIACALFWFSPVHRAVRRRLVALRERACDAAVLARGCAPDSYLAALMKSCQSSLESSAVASMSRLQLKERMESIMTFEQQSASRRMSWAARVAVVAVTGLVATAFALFAPSPYIHAATPGQFSAEVWVRPTPDGRYVTTIRLDAPDGPFTTVAVMDSVPDERTVTSSHGGRTYKVVVHTNADTSGTADVEVREGENVVWTSTRTFAAAAPLRVVPSTKPEDGRYSRMSPDMKPPKLIHSVEPVYTAEAKAERIAGIVILETLINEQGTVDDVHVMKGLPHGLDQAAVDAVKQWRFEPASIDGKVVPVIFNLTINFRLE